MTHPSTPYRTLLSFVVTALAVILPANPIEAQTLHVSTYGADSNSGANWLGALRTVRRALQIAETDSGWDRIEVAQGTYTPGLLRTQHFNLVENVTMVGGYAPGGSSTPNSDLYPTVLSGDIGVIGDASDNSYVVLVALSAVGVRLEGFEIRDGRSTLYSTGPFAHGGGLFAENSRIVLYNCTFTKNGGRLGGAVWLNQTGATFSECRFIDNDALAGGAVQNASPGNSAGVLMSKCHFLGNRSSSHGGAIANEGKLSIYSTVFSGNHANTYGGAIADGGNLHSTYIANCTFANNRALVQGGAYNGELVGTTRLVNSIFWNNTHLHPGATREISPPGLGWITHCAIENLSSLSLAGYANFDLDPQLLDELGPDGIAGTTDDDVHIRRTSPCINAGQNTAVPIFAAFDMDNSPRIQRPSWFTAMTVDIGADEVGPLSALFPGSGEDLVMSVAVDGYEDCIDDTDAIAVPAGSALITTTFSPGGTLVGKQCIVTFDMFSGDNPPTHPMSPVAHFSAGTLFLSIPSLPAAGIKVGIVPVSTSLTGRAMMQGLVLSHTAANGFFVASNGRELRFD